MPCSPLRMTSASASITRTVSPQPAEQSGQTLGFHSATPGTSSSSGMKRIRCSSGFPQLASVAPAPVTAVSLMKSRRCLLDMTRQTIVRRVLLPVTVHAESHRQIDVSLGHGLLRDRAVTGRAFHVRPDVRRVVEMHVRSVRVAVDALPGEIVAALLNRGHLLDERPVGGN